MFQIRAIDHVVIRAIDLERSIAFYCDVLGCRIDKRNDPLGLVHLRAGSALIDLVSVDGELGRRGGDAPAANARNMDHLCLRIEPFDSNELAAHLRRHGVEVRGVGERYGAEGDGESLYLDDPEGNTIELKGPPRAAHPANRSAAQQQGEPQ